MKTTEDTKLFVYLLLKLLTRLFKTIKLKHAWLVCFLNSVPPVKKSEQKSSLAALLRQSLLSSFEK